MPATLVHDILLELIEHLHDDPRSLYSWIRTSRFWRTRITPILWRMPFIYLNQLNYKESSCRALIRTYVSCLTRTQRQYYIKRKILSKNEALPTVNYGQYIDRLDDHVIVGVLAGTGWFTTYSSRLNIFDALLKLFVTSSQRLTHISLTESYVNPWRSCFFPRTLTSLKLNISSYFYQLAMKTIRLQEALEELTLLHGQGDILQLYFDFVEPQKESLRKITFIECAISDAYVARSDFNNKVPPKLKELRFEKCSELDVETLEDMLSGRMQLKEEEENVFVFLGQ
jgi:hypothetical protein